MSGRWLGPLVAMAFGFVLFVVVAEGGARLYFSRHISYDIEMWRYARELKTVGRTPGLRFEHRPEQRTRLMGVEVTTNSDGLRDRSVSRQSSPGVFRIAVIGDSITFGWGVPQEQTYPQQLEAELNRLRPLGPERTFEVLNFGVGNYNIADAAAMLEHKALSYRPDLVIYGAFINDAELPRVDNHPWWMKHSLFAVWVWGRIDGLLRGLGTREDFQTYYLGLYRESGEGRQLVHRQLERMSNLCRQAGVPLLVAFLPELHADSEEVFATIQIFYREASRQVGAPFVDLGESLSGESRRRFWVTDDDAHPDAKACGLYAAALARMVENQVRAVAAPTPQDGYR